MDVLDGAAIGDVDYTAAAVLARVSRTPPPTTHPLRLSTVLGPVREQLDRYGISAPSAPTPTTTLPERHSRPSTPQKGESVSRRRT